MDLRFTDTNAADDAAGRAFGLEGNLYLPVVAAALAGVGLFAALAFLIGLSLVAASLFAAAPIFLTLAWALGLKKGRPPGYDRDFLEYLTGGGSFAPVAAQQREDAS
ncbi:MAG: hypothetical protein RL091_1322 [Verrucomicrobiota bacterium]|jgi:hypothetical protein